MSLRPSLDSSSMSPGSSLSINDLGVMPSMDAQVHNVSTLSMCSGGRKGYTFIQTSKVDIECVHYVYSGWIYQEKEIWALLSDQCGMSDLACQREEKYVKDGINVYSTDVFHTNVQLMVLTQLKSKNIDWIQLRKYLQLIVKINPLILLQHVSVPDFHFVNTVLRVIIGDKISLSSSSEYGTIRDSNIEVKRNILSCLFELALCDVGWKGGSKTRMLILLAGILDDTEFTGALSADLCLFFAEYTTSGRHLDFLSTTHHVDPVYCTSVPEHKTGSLIDVHAIFEYSDKPKLSDQSVAIDVLGSAQLRHPCAFPALEVLKKRCPEELVPALHRLKTLPIQAIPVLLEWLKHGPTEAALLGTPIDRQTLSSLLQKCKGNVSSILTHIFRHRDVDPLSHLTEQRYLHVLAPLKSKEGKFMGLPGDFYCVQHLTAFARCFQNSPLEHTVNDMMRACLAVSEDNNVAVETGGLGRLVAELEVKRSLTSVQWKWWCEEYRKCTDPDALELLWRVLDYLYVENKCTSVLLDIRVFYHYFLSLRGRTVSTVVSKLITDMYVDVEARCRTSDSMPTVYTQPLSRTLLALLQLYSPCDTVVTAPALLLCSALGKTACLGCVPNDLWVFAVHTIVNTNPSISGVHCLWETKLLNFFALDSHEQTYTPLLSWYVSLSSNNMHIEISHGDIETTTTALVVQRHHSTMVGMLRVDDLPKFLPAHPLLSVCFFFQLLPHIHQAELHLLRRLPSMEAPNSTLSLPLRDLSQIHRAIHVHTGLPLPPSQATALPVAELLLQYLTDSRPQLRAMTSVMCCLALHVTQYHWDPLQLSYTWTGSIPGSLGVRVKDGEVVVKGTLVKGVKYPISLLASKEAQLVIPHSSNSIPANGVLGALVENQQRGSCRDESSTDVVATGIAPWLTILFCGIDVSPTNSPCGCPLLPANLPSPVYAIASLLNWIHETNTQVGFAGFLLSLFSTMQEHLPIDSVNWPFLGCHSSARVESIETSFLPSTANYFDQVKLYSGDHIDLSVFRKDIPPSRNAMQLCASRNGLLRSVHGQAILSYYACQGLIVPCPAPTDSRQEAPLFAILAVILAFTDQITTNDDTLSLWFPFSTDTLYTVHRSLSTTLSLLRSRPRIITDVQVLYKHTIPALVLILANLPVHSSNIAVCPLPTVLHHSLAVTIGEQTDPLVLHILNLLTTISSFLHLTHPSLIFVQQNCILPVIFNSSLSFTEKLRAIAYLQHYFALPIATLIGLSPKSGDSGLNERDAAAYSVDLLILVFDCIATDNTKLLNLVALYLFPELNDITLSSLEALEQTLSQANTKMCATFLQSLHVASMPSFLLRKITEPFQSRPRRVAWKPAKSVPFHKDSTKVAVTSMFKHGVDTWVDIPRVSPLVLADMQFCSAQFCLTALRRLGLVFPSTVSAIQPKIISLLVSQLDFNVPVGPLYAFLCSAEQQLCIRRASTIQALVSLCQTSLSTTMFNTVFASFSEYVDSLPESKLDVLSTMFQGELDSDPKPKGHFGGYQYQRMYLVSNNVQSQPGHTLAQFLDKPFPADVLPTTLYDTTLEQPPQHVLLLHCCLQLIQTRNPKARAHDQTSSQTSPTPLQPVSVRTVLVKYFDESASLTVDNTALIKTLNELMPLLGAQNPQIVHAQTLRCILGIFRANPGASLWLRAQVELEYQYFQRYGRRTAAAEGWGSSTDPILMRLGHFVCFSRLYKFCLLRFAERTLSVPVARVLAHLGSPVHVPPSLAPLCEFPLQQLQSSHLGANVPAHLKKWIPLIDTVISWSDVFDTVHPHVFAVLCLRRWVLPALLDTNNAGKSNDQISTVLQELLSIIGVDIALINTVRCLKTSSFCHQDKKSRGGNEITDVCPRVEPSAQDDASKLLLEKQGVNYSTLWCYLMVSPYIDFVPYVKDTYRVPDRYVHSRLDALPQLDPTSTDWQQQLMLNWAKLVAAAMRYSVDRDLLMLKLAGQPGIETARMQRTRTFATVLESMSLQLGGHSEPATFFVPLLLQISLQLASSAAVQRIQTNYAGPDYYRFQGSYLNVENSGEYTSITTLCDWPLLFLHLQLYRAMKDPNTASASQVLSILDFIYESTARISRNHVVNVQNMGTHSLDCSLAQFAFRAPLYLHAHRQSNDPLLAHLGNSSQLIDDFYAKYPVEVSSHWDGEDNGISQYLARYAKSPHRHELWKCYFSEVDPEGYADLQLDDPDQDILKTLLPPQLLPALTPEFPVNNHPFAPGPMFNPRSDSDRATPAEAQLLCPYASTLLWRQLDLDLEAGAWTTNPLDSITMCTFTQAHISMYRHRLAHICSRLALHESMEYAENTVPLKYLEEVPQVQGEVYGKRVSHLPFSARYRVAMPVSSHVHTGIDATKKGDLQTLIKESITAYGQLKTRPVHPVPQKLIGTLDALEAYKHAPAYTHEWKSQTLLPCLPLLDFVHFVKTKSTSHATIEFTENYSVKYLAHRTKLLLSRLYQVPAFLTDTVYYTEIRKHRDRRRALHEHLSFPRAASIERAGPPVPTLGSDAMLGSSAEYNFLRELRVISSPSFSSSTQSVGSRMDSVELYGSGDFARAIGLEELDVYIARAKETAHTVKLGTIPVSSPSKQAYNEQLQLCLETGVKSARNVLAIHNHLNLPALYTPRALQLPLLLTSPSNSSHYRAYGKEITDFAQNSGLNVDSALKLASCERALDALLSKDRETQVTALLQQLSLGDPHQLEDTGLFVAECMDVMLLSKPIDLPEQSSLPSTKPPGLPWVLDNTGDVDSSKQSYSWTKQIGDATLLPSLCARITCWGETARYLEMSHVQRPEDTTLALVEATRTRMTDFVVRAKSVLQAAVCAHLSAEPPLFTGTQTGWLAGESQNTSSSMLSDVSGVDEVNQQTRISALFKRQDDVPSITGWSVAQDYAIFGLIKPTSVYAEKKLVARSEALWVEVMEQRKRLLATVGQLIGTDTSSSAYHAFLAKCALNAYQDLTVFVSEYGTLQAEQVHEHSAQDDGADAPTLIPITLATASFHTGLAKAATYRVLGELHQHMYREIVLTKRSVYEEVLSSVRVRAKDISMANLHVDINTQMKNTPSALKHYFAQLCAYQATLTATAVKAVLFLLYSIRKETQPHRSQSVLSSLVQLAETFEAEVSDQRLPRGYTHQQVYGAVWPDERKGLIQGVDWFLPQCSPPSEASLGRDKLDHEHQSSSVFGPDLLGPQLVVRWIHNGIRELLDPRSLSGSISLFSGKLGSLSRSVRDAMTNTLQRTAKRLPHHVQWHQAKNINFNERDRTDADQCARAVVEAVQRSNPSFQTAVQVVSQLVSVAESKVEKGRSRRRLTEIPAAVALKEMLPTWICVPTHAALDACVRNAYSDSMFTLDNHTNIPVSMAYDNAMYIWRGLKDEVYVFSSKEMPKKLDLITECGKDIGIIVKKEPQGDMRKDAKAMETIELVNRLQSSDQQETVVPSYQVTVLGNRCGVLEFVNHATTIRQLVRELNAPLGRVCTNDMIMAFMQLRSRNGGPNQKQHCSLEEFRMLKRMSPPILGQGQRYKCPNPRQWVHNSRLFSTHTAAWTIIGYVLGLGDRHTDNIMILSDSWGVCHVDFDCLFEKGATLPTPETVPARLTHNIVDVLGVHGIGGLFQAVCTKTLAVMRNNCALLLPVFNVFIEDVSAGSDRKGPAMKALREIREKIQGRVGEAGSLLQVHNQVAKICKDCTDEKNLAAMFVGWSPWV